MRKEENYDKFWARGYAPGIDVSLEEMCENLEFAADALRDEIKESYGDSGAQLGSMAKMSNDFQERADKMKGLL